jgi:BioD-like phosphotransacetylase family protein
MADSAETINQMIRLIQQEAREKAEVINEDAKHRLQIEHNRIYKEEREKLIKEFRKKEEDEVVAKRL